MTLLLAPRMARVRPSATAAVSDRARDLVQSGRSITNLGEGELDFDTPDHIKDAAIAAIRAGKTKYTAVSGTPELKAAIIEKFRQENRLEYEAAEIIAGTGAKQLIFNALMATVSEGDEVIIPAPYWVSYPDMVALADGTPKIVGCVEGDGWLLRPAALAAAITPRTRWLLLNAPGNPSGAVYAEADLRALADVLLQHPDVLILSDDIYEHVVFEGSFATLAAVEPRLKPRILTVNGVSKAYSMTGWRIGYAGGPAWLIRAMQTLQSQSTTNPSSISQAAATEALRGGIGFMKDWIAVLRQRRDIAAGLLAQAQGLRCATPKGAFYLFVDCSDLLGRRTPAGAVIETDVDCATYLLDVAGAAVVPGSAFGMSGYFRVAFGVDTERLRAACVNIVEACRSLGRETRPS